MKVNASKKLGQMNSPVIVYNITLGKESWLGYLGLLTLIGFGLLRIALSEKGTILSPPNKLCIIWI